MALEDNIRFYWPPPPAGTLLACTNNLNQFPLILLPPVPNTHCRHRRLGSSFLIQKLPRARSSLIFLTARTDDCSTNAATDCAARRSTTVVDSPTTTTHCDRVCAANNSVFLPLYKYSCTYAEWRSIRKNIVLVHFFLRSAAGGLSALVL